MKKVEDREEKCKENSFMKKMKEKQDKEYPDKPRAAQKLIDNARVCKRRMGKTVRIYTDIYSNQYAHKECGEEHRNGGLIFTDRQ